MLPSRLSVLNVTVNTSYSSQCISRLNVGEPPAHATQPRLSNLFVTNVAATLVPSPLVPSCLPVVRLVVFGEGVVNDAVSVVLLGAIDRSTRDGAWTGGWAGFIFNFLFLLVSSFTLGALAGLGIAFVLKTTKFVGPHQVRGKT